MDKTNLQMDLFEYNPELSSLLVQLMDQINKRDRMIDTLTMEKTSLEILNQKILEREQIIHDLNQKILEREQTIQETDQKVSSLTAQTAEKDQAVRDLATQVEENDCLIISLKNQVAEIQTQMNLSLAVKSGLEHDLAVVRTAANQNQQAVSELKSKLEAIVSSNQWKYSTYFKRLKDRLVPQNSFLERASIKTFSIVKKPFLRLLRYWQNKKDLSLVKNSIYFDPRWYLKSNPDLASFKSDLALHYFHFGGFESRDPGPHFSSSWYLNHYPDVRELGVNPLVHYLRFGRAEGRYKAEVEVQGSNAENAIIRQAYELTDLLLDKPFYPQVQVKKPVDILIPVYNGKQFLLPLLNSIARNTEIPFRMLVANDKSPDPEISPILHEFKRTHPDLDMTIYENEANFGFVKTVNKLASLSKNHFVILNTDVEVPPHWLERMIYPILNKPKVASVTPFTNSGTICSFPRHLENNPLFDGLDVETLDRYFQYVDFDKNFIEIPTAVGFCMAVNKNLYDRIGLFDEQFGMGYGEENDWCMRARSQGYTNIIAPNIFVYHKHGGSFSQQFKESLCKNNYELLRIKHPTYFSEVARFVQTNPLENLRDILVIKILSDQHLASLIIDHALGGGASIFIKELSASKQISFTLTKEANSSKFSLEVFGRGLPTPINLRLIDINDLGSMVNAFEIKEIIINELFSYSNVFDIMDLVSNVLSSNKIKSTYYVHDFYSICPMPNLLDFNIGFCGIPSDLSICNKCLMVNPLLKLYASYVLQDYPKLTIAEWRSKFYGFLSTIDQIICFSNNSKQLMQRAFPGLLDNKFLVQPHEVNWVRPIKPGNHGSRLNVAVIGNVSIGKGGHIISGLASYIDQDQLNIKLHIFGEVLEPSLGLEHINTIQIHGKYQKGDLPVLMEEYEIDLVFIPSIWPETFSYTTEEAIQMWMPVAVFNLGAPAERASVYNKGIVIDEMDPESILRAIFRYYGKQFPSAVTRTNGEQIGEIVFVCVSNNDLPLTRSYYSSSYMSRYKIVKYDNRDVNVPITTRYNNAIEELISANFQGWIFFVHNDFSIVEPLEELLNGLDHNRLYGPIGARLLDGRKVLVGQIHQFHGNGFIDHGTEILIPSPVDTLDCQCVFFHSDLLSYNIRFDENAALNFHQYVEEFCISAKINHNIFSYAVPMNCRHLSWGRLDNNFYVAIDYINKKYKNTNWAGTCTHLNI